MGDDDEIRRPLLRQRVPGDGADGDAESNSYDSFPSPVSEVDKASDENKKKPGVPVYKVYKRRWYIIIIFGLYAGVQNCVWNTWGPISTTSKEAFNWDNATIAWLANWGPISFILVGLFYPWLLQAKGLRWAVVSSALLAAVGASLRVITSEPGPATILIHIGQFLNGLAGPVGMGGIPAASASWFPPHERITATSVGNSLGAFGLVLSFVVGPALVSGGPPDNSTTTNSSKSDLHLRGFYDSGFGVYEPMNVTTARIHKEREDIMRYMYYECGFAWLITLCLIFYFPAKPPLPPSASATMERDKYWAGLWSLKGKGYFLLVAVIYGLSLGVVNCWSGVLNVNLATINVSESEAGWIGCYATIAVCVFELIIGRFADYFTRNIKLFILVLYILGTGCFVVFALMLIKIIAFSEILLYSTIICGMLFINAAVPLMFELACELAYPTGEAAANGFLTYINNAAGLIFLGVFSFPNVGTMWMNWALIGSCAACIPLIIMLRGTFNRLDVDEGAQNAQIQSHLEQEVIVDPTRQRDPTYTIQSNETNNGGYRHKDSV